MDQQPQPVVVTPTAPEVPTQPKKSKQKLLVMIGVIGVVLVGVIAVAAQGLLNSPERVWERGLNNSAKGIDTLIELSNQQADGMKINGFFSARTPFAADGTIDGHFHGGTGTMTLDVGAGGFRFSGEMRAVDSATSDNPDLYFRVGGLEAISALLAFGAPVPVGGDIDLAQLLSDIDNQWYVVDHTLLDQLESSATDTDTSEISEEDIRASVMKAADVLDEYMFTTDDSKAVLEVRETYGREDFEGTSTQKYKAGVNKDRFKDMVVALREALRDTAFANFVTDGSSRSYDDITNLDGYLSELDDMDFSKLTADVWMEASGRYIRNVRIYLIEDRQDSNYIDIGIPFEGGDVVPFLIRITVDDAGSQGTFSFGVDINTTNADSRLWFDIDADLNQEKTELSGEISLTNTDEPASVDAPTGAKNVFELLSVLDGGAPSSNPFTLPDTSDSFLPIDDFEL